MTKGAHLRPKGFITNHYAKEAWRSSNHASSLLHIWRELADEQLMNRGQENLGDRLRNQRSVGSDAYMLSPNMSPRPGSEPRGGFDDVGGSEDEFRYGHKIGVVNSLPTLVGKAKGRGWCILLGDGWIVAQGKARVAVPQRAIAWKENGVVRLRLRG
ncbi:hypothetical protein RJ641_008409 [Dillenia turbinata]|uniref:Uncharacterized protein n=1 Tax=Dillenia turbinata TaxID=194707 RepID=A0AAN8V3A8_9MAGN